MSGRNRPAPRTALPLGQSCTRWFLGTRSFTCCQGTPSGSPVGGATAPCLPSQEGARKQSLNIHTTVQDTEACPSLWPLSFGGFPDLPTSPPPARQVEVQGLSAFPVPKGSSGLRLQHPLRMFWHGLCFISEQWKLRYRRKFYCCSFHMGPRMATPVIQSHYCC